MKTIARALGALVFAAGCCGGGFIADGPSSATTNVTTGVTATSPAEPYYDRLARLAPSKIPESLRRDFNWAFDPATGRLLPLSDAYERAAAENCGARCVLASYMEMVDRLHSWLPIPSIPDRGDDDGCGCGG